MARIRMLGRLIALCFWLVACAAPAATPTPAPTTAPAVPTATTAAKLEATARPAARLRVVATFSILGDLVQQVGQDRIEPRTLVPPGSDAHTFEPSPADSKALAEAALVFENGLGFEPWLDKLAAAAGSKAKRIVVTRDITPLPAVDDDYDAPPAAKPGDTAADKTDAGAHEGEEVNPHAWHDVNNTILMVATIRAALAAADPAGAAAYQANAERYTVELRQLDAWVVEQVKTVPEPRRKLVTTHDTFAYFARRYGFTVVGTALGSITTDVAEPSAGEFARLVQEIKAAQVPAIFAENVANPKLMERLAQEAGVKLIPALYTDALGQPGSAGDSYAKIMRHNVSAIVTALAA